ncbi:MAG: electron transport complex subunit RsxC [Gammaproteobacteria bacterium]|nr:electron transport complex subunit RsxC [Gammaproteobacteria bacterium]MDH5776894.1 electron transport complex subunit RsxC [Gammaproteobacteria bacterium]
MTNAVGRFHGGLHLEDHKACSMQSAIVAAPLPEQLIIPLLQHIGAPLEPLVKPGDHVFKGQLIADSDANLSAPVHAPSSGTISAIEERSIPHPSGRAEKCIVIETDGKDEWPGDRQTYKNYQSLSADQLRTIIRQAGIVGLGGAGFPSHIKLNPGQHQINTLILNGAECEPYISCDAMLMQERPRDIINGLKIIRQTVNARQCLIGIEDNKPAAIAALSNCLNDDEKQYIKIITVPTLYPSGGEKQLIKLLTNLEVPSRQHPVDVGVVCHNVGTAIAVADAVIEGIPLISRTMTITGGAVNKPANIQSLLGTPMRHLLTACGLDDHKLQRLIMGGPMMGFEISSMDTPVIKTTNCLLAMDKQETGEPQTALPCIRCGECAVVCPAQLLPQQLYWWAKARDFDKTQEYNLFDCIECGCCSYVCPSHIPLVHYYRFAKTAILEEERDRIKSDRARDRHDFRLLRLERKKQEDEERKRKKKELLKKVNDDKSDSKKSEIEAALERVKAKKQATRETEQSRDS